MGSRRTVCGSPAYILRYANARRFVGLCAADNEDDLCFLIDEETDPAGYEYAILHDGYGIEFRKDGGPVRYKIGKGAKALRRALRSANHVYMTFELTGALIDGTNLTWVALAES